MGFIAEDQHLVYKTLVATNEYADQEKKSQAKINFTISAGNRNTFSFIETLIAIFFHNYRSYYIYFFLEYYSIGKS